MFQSMDLLFGQNAEISPSCDNTGYSPLWPVRNIVFMREWGAEFLGREEWVSFEMWLLILASRGEPYVSEVSLFPSTMHGCKSMLI